MAECPSKKWLIKTIILLGFLFLINPQQISAVPVPVETLDEKIDRYADLHKVASSTMRHIVNNESGGQKDIVGDTKYICPLTGKIAPSRGIVQINECWHPDIRKDQAEDVDFSLNFLAYNLSKGKCKMWSTCPQKKIIASGS